MTKRQKAPGKAHRKGLTLIDAVNKFSDESSAEAWFVEQRWPDGIACPHCGSKDRIQPRASRKPMPFYCGDCRRYFSVRTGTVLRESKLALSKWAIALYLYSTNLKGVSSMKLHRDLGITQKSAWFLAHRIREAWNLTGGKFAGPVETDEVFIGGKESNKHESKKLHAGRGPVGKAVVVGAKDRQTNQISAAHVGGTDRATLHGFITDRTEPDATIYTDEGPSYRGLPREHYAVRHRISEYVSGMAHTNGIESFWALLKRGYHGTYHKFSVKHLDRYVQEFAGRHNQRPLNTIDQMAAMAHGLDGKQLTYEELIGPRETRQPKMF